MGRNPGAEEHDAPWAAAITEGSETTVLRWQIRDNPEAMKTIILADNAKHGANLVEHHLQMVRRLAMWCRAEVRVQGEVNKRLLVNKLLRTSPTTTAPEAEALLNLASRVQGSPVLAEAEEFKNRFMKTSKVDCEAAFYGQAAALPLQLDYFRGAVIKCQLTCPPDKMVKNTAKFIARSDLDRICDTTKAPFAHALQAEHVMASFRETFRVPLALLSSEDRVDMITRLDCQLARIVLKRPCKYQTLAGVAAAEHQRLKELGCNPGVCPWAAEEPGGASPGAPPGGASPGAGGDTLLLVQYDSAGGVRVDNLLKDAGIKEGCYVAATAPLQDQPENEGEDPPEPWAAPGTAWFLKTLAAPTKKDPDGLAALTRTTPAGPVERVVPLTFLKDHFALTAAKTYEWLDLTRASPEVFPAEAKMIGLLAMRLLDERAEV